MFLTKKWLKFFDNTTTTGNGEDTRDEDVDAGVVNITNIRATLNIEDDLKIHNIDNCDDKDENISNNDDDDDKLEELEAMNDENEWECDNEVDDEEQEVQDDGEEGKATDDFY